jgi:hypothetical protein
MEKQLKQFILVYNDDSNDITNHYDINEVKSLYLNEQIRTSDGTVKTCIEVLENI